MCAGTESASTAWKPGRQVNMTVRFSDFNIPPAEDALLIGRRAPIGPEAMRQALDVLSPGEYEVVRLDHGVFEAAALKKSLTQIIPQDTLVTVLLEEGERVATEKNMIKAQVNCVVEVTRVVTL